MKTCNKCHISKSLQDFVNDARLKSGKGPHCKQCRSLRVKQEWADGLNRKTEAQKEKTRQYSSSWSKANRDKKRRDYSKWASQNPEANRLRNHARRLKIRASSYKILPKEMRRLYSQSCFVCGSTNRIEADHIIAVARGGNHSIGNLLALCRSCNAKKSDKPLVYLRYKKTFK